MEEKDRWSIHIEYLKIAIALATALIAAGAAIYVDVSKIPTDHSRYILLGGIGVFFLTLITSVYSVASLGNHFLHEPRAGAVAPVAGTPEAAALAEARNRRARRVVRWANFSFFALVLGAGLLGCFFTIRTLDAGGTAFERAIATANVASGKLVETAKGESETLKSIEALTDSYRLVFEVAPGGGNITVLTDALGTNLKSATRK
jgi:hypothetical protein